MDGGRGDGDGETLALSLPGYLKWNYLLISPKTNQFGKSTSKIRVALVSQFRMNINRVIEIWNQESKT